MDALANALVYLGTGVITTVTHQILVYQGAGAPMAMLVPFFNYLGMAMVQLWPQRCGGLASTTIAIVKREEERKEAAAALQQGDDGTTRRATVKIGDSHGVASAAAAAGGAPAGKQHGTRAAGANEVVLCPMGQRTGPCMPGWLHSLLSRPLPTDGIIMSSVLLDISGFAAGTVGVKLAGSGVYQVVHASVVVFAALFAWLLRGRSISRAQWGAILLITTGLVISAMGAGGSSAKPSSSGSATALSHPSTPLGDGSGAADVDVAGRDSWFGAGPSESGGGGGGGRRLMAVGGEGAEASDTASIVWGILFTLAGSIAYGLNYSLLDALSSSPSAPAQSRLAGTIGLWAAAGVSLWVLVHTLPNWDELLTLPARDAGSTGSALLLGFGAIGASALAHSLAYFRLLKGHGAVMIGVLQAMRAALVFLAGSVLFCGLQESQCLTAPRGVAATLVTLGVMAFAGSKRRASAASASSPVAATPRTAQPQQSTATATRHTSEE